MAQKDIDHNYIDDSYIESKPLPSQALLKEVGSKKIKCGIYKYRDREKDVSITFTLKANHSDEQLKEYLNRVDMTKDVLCIHYLLNNQLLTDKIVLFVLPFWILFYFFASEL